MLDKVITAAIATYIVLGVGFAVLQGGTAMPLVAVIVVVAAIVVGLLGHMVKHLGPRLAVVFFVTATVVEWAFEESNIQFGGFIWGDLRYGEILGPHLGSVPVAVPLVMAAILWPAYACVNLVLDGRVVVDPRSMPWWQTLWRFALYAMVHASYAFAFDGLCRQWGIYQWVGNTLSTYSSADLFFGDPRLPWGWAIWVVMVMVIFFALTKLRTLGQHIADTGTRRLTWADAAPIVFLAMACVQVYLQAVNDAVGNVTLWTLGFFAALVGYKFVAILRSQMPADNTATADRQLTMT
ncbi:hypothetical protein [Mycobacterium sp.]|uniref:hypothetical protein n=1 Tax=Mycobacterium sp. TaxID=1785 RepID=UPI003BA8AC53